MAKVQGNLDGLNKLTKLLKEDYTLRVGILGSRARSQHDSESGVTNAELGVFHEFGTVKMPQRSFLWMPLVEKLNFDNPDMQNFKKVVWKQLFVKKAPEEFYKALAELAMTAINECFATRGFGMWKPLSDSTTKAFEREAGIQNWRTGNIARFRKGLKATEERLTLVKTGQMKKAISFKIFKG